MHAQPLPSEQGRDQLPARSDQRFLFATRRRHAITAVGRHQSMQAHRVEACAARQGAALLKLWNTAQQRQLERCNLRRDPPRAECAPATDLRHAALEGCSIASRLRVFYPCVESAPGLDMIEGAHGEHAQLVLLRSLLDVRCDHRGHAVEGGL